MQNLTYKNFIHIVKEALIYEKRNNFTKSFNLYTQAISFTNNLDTILKLKSKKAWCLHKVGNYNESLAMFNNLIIEHSNQPLSYLLLATYYQKINKIKHARTILSKGIEIFPDYIECYLMLASILKDSERSKEAIDILKKVLYRETLSEGKIIRRKDIWAELGSMYFERGNYNSSLACLKKSLKLDKEENFLHYELMSKCYLKLEDPQNTLKYIHDYMKYYTEFSQEEYILCARAYSKLGDYENSMSALLSAYNLDSFLILKSEEMFDFSQLVQIGFFDSLENFEIVD